MTSKINNKKIHSSLNLPVKAIMGNSAGFMSKNEKLVLPLGSCTSIVCVGSNGKNAHIVAANHIQTGKPQKGNKFDAFTLTENLISGYKKKYGILSHQIRPLFFVGGNLSGESYCYSNRTKNLIDPGADNIKYSKLAMKELNLNPYFQFVGNSISLHLLMNENFLFALINNNESSMGNGNLCRHFYEFIAIDLKKIYRRENNGLTIKKSRLREKDQIYKLTELIDAFRKGELKADSFHNGLYFVAKI